MPEQQNQGVELLLRDGSKLQLRTRQGFTSEVTADRTERLLQRVVDARSQWRGAVKHLTALLDGSNREPRAWTILR